MLFIVGFVSLIVLSIIGFFRAEKRIKIDHEFFFFTFMKWIAAGWAVLGLCAYVMVLQDGSGDKKALFWFTTGLTIGIIACEIIDKICVANSLKQKKIEEYKKAKKDSWE